MSRTRNILVTCAQPGASMIDNADRFAARPPRYCDESQVSISLGLMSPIVMNALNMLSPPNQMGHQRHISLAPRGGVTDG